MLYLIILFSILFGLVIYIVVDNITSIKIQKVQDTRYKKRRHHFSSQYDVDEDYQDYWVWVDVNGKFWHIDYHDNFIFCDKSNINVKDNTKFKEYLF